MVFEIFPLAEKYEQRCTTYFEGVTLIIETIRQEDLFELQP